MPPPTVSPDDLDDLIYFSRTNDLPSLRETLTSLSSQHNTPASALLASAIDIDADGLGSRCCLLHWPAANGHVEVLAYLLGVLKEDKKGDVAAAGDKNELHLPVNHRNVNGNTPLHWAALNARLECVRLLVEAGADATVVNEVGHDAVFEAEVGGREGSEEVVKWMLEHCGGLEKGFGGGEKGGEEVEGVEENGDGTNASGEVSVNGKMEDGTESKTEEGAD